MLPIPISYTGVGMLIDGGRKVTITQRRHSRLQGRHPRAQSPDLHLTRNDLSYNWKQRLYSGIEKESLVDWMSYHQNEKDEWLRFGAGDLPRRLRSRRDRPQHDRAGAERTDGHAIDRAEDLEQHHPVPLRHRRRPVPRHRQHDHAQPHRLVRARLQPRLLQPRPGLGRAADVRAVEPQHRRLQLDHARRRRAVPLGRAVDDGHRARAARTTTCSFRNDFSHAPHQRDRGDVQSQLVHR